MSKKKPTIKSLGRQLDSARRLYAGEAYDRAAERLTELKADAEVVLAEQQEAMTREMNYHLQLRRQLNDLTHAAVDLSREVKEKRHDTEGQ